MMGDSPFISQKNMRRGDTAQHLLEARDYMRSIANHGLDVSALFIAQAYLTKVQSSLKPNGALEALFQEEDLRALVEVSEGREGARSGNDGQRIITEPLLKYFKIATPLQTLPCEPTSPTEVAHLMARILDSLEEWEVISGKASRLAERMESARRQRRESREVKRLEESLEAYLDKIMLPHHAAEFTTVQSINQTYSVQDAPASVDSNSEIGEENGQVRENEVALFLGYLSMWMGQALQEIGELKGILNLAQSQSSIDLDCSQTLRPPNPKKGRIAKSSLLTSKIKQGYLDVPHIQNNFFDENKRPVSPINAPKSVGCLKSQMSFRSPRKPERGGRSHRVTLGKLDLNGEARPKQSRQTCNCELY